ncbi:MAG: J domain-containing protein [Paludibacteraceae bacterium]|nr:J domain-containing protein [Paludibacteraceae bacterium]
MQTSSIYHKILGVQPDASIEEIKKAYKRKAKEFHPDFNPSPTAHEDFIKINEAYVQLTSRKQSNNYWTKREEERRNYAQEQAREFAQRRYKDFSNSKYYKEMLQINEYSDIAFYLLALTIINAVAFVVADNLTELSIIDSPNAWIVPAALSGIFAYFTFPHTKFKSISRFENDIHPIEWGLLGIALTIDTFGNLLIGTSTLIPFWIPLIGIIVPCTLLLLTINTDSIRWITHPLFGGLLPMAIFFISNNYSDKYSTQRYTNEESYRIEFKDNYFTRQLIERETEWLHFYPYSNIPIHLKEGRWGYIIYDKILIQ